LADEDGDFTVIERREIDASVLKVRIAGVSGGIAKPDLDMRLVEFHLTEKKLASKLAPTPKVGDVAPPPVAPQAETGDRTSGSSLSPAAACFSACSWRGSWCLA